MSFRLPENEFTVQMELTLQRSLCRSLISCEILHSDVELASASSARTGTPCKSCAAHAHCKPQRSLTKSTKPAIKSIILNASSHPLDSPQLKKLNIKQEPANDDNEMSDTNVPKSLRRIERPCKEAVNSESTRKAAEATAYSFTPPRDSSQLKTKKMLGKSATVAVDYRQSPRDRNHSNRRSRQKSPGRRHSSRRKSKSADRSSRSRSSDSDRYSRQSSSRESTPRRSRSRRVVSRRSRSHGSRYRSRSRHSRDTRSYGSTTSTSSSDSDRRSNSRYRGEQRDTSKRSVDRHHDTNSRGSHSKHRSESPTTGDRKAFNYHNSIITTSQRSNGRSEKPPSTPLKRFAGATFGDSQGPEISKKYVIKPQPIVKLHSEPGTDSDDDGKIEREYEELLTFETNEDERREQRLLKALSDIAAKAKQKIQSITNESNIVSVPTMVNSMQHDVCPKTTNEKPFRSNVWTASNEKSNDRRSTSYHNDDYSPKTKHPSRRSRKDEDGTTKIPKAPYVLTASKLEHTFKLTLTDFPYRLDGHRDPHRFQGGAAHQASSIDEESQGTFLMIHSNSNESKHQINFSDIFYSF